MKKAKNKNSISSAEMDVALREFDAEANAFFTHVFQAKAVIRAATRLVNEDSYYVDGKRLRKRDELFKALKAFMGRSR